MQSTNVDDPNYFHKVVDCQWACPAHTPVPEYIRLIAEERYTEAYMLNWDSNVFPVCSGVPAIVHVSQPADACVLKKKPVAICRLKRVAADNKGDVSAYMPAVPIAKNGKRIALIGAGPASLAVARDLLPFGYEVHLFEKDAKGGGFMRSQIPAFRLPEEVLDEEVERILDMGVVCHFGEEIGSMKTRMEQDFDAYCVGPGAPRGRDLELWGRPEVDDYIHIGIDWLSSVAFGHITEISGKVIVMGGGNTAMDCCRTSLRLGAESVKVVVRSAFEVMKASEWEKEDAMREGIPIINNRPPKEFVHENGKLKAYYSSVLLQCGARMVVYVTNRRASLMSSLRLTMSLWRLGRIIIAHGLSAIWGLSSTSGIVRYWMRSRCNQITPKYFLVVIVHLDRRISFGPRPMLIGPQ